MKLRNKITNSQGNQILKHLGDGNTLTQIEALNMFRCMRLASRIYDLRDQGWQIITTTIGSGRSKYAQYSMSEETQNKVKEYYKPVKFRL